MEYFTPGVPQSAEAGDTIKPMSAPRILVADDDAWILKMVTTVLQKRGYVVETASDGEEALEKAIADPPDLVITDVMMPKLDGWTLVKALRARPEFSFVPVIFLTALGSDDDRIRGFRLGADDFLPKPFRFEELDLRVAKTLKNRVIVERETRETLSAPAEGSNNAGRSKNSADRPRSEPGLGLTGSLTQVGVPSLLTLLEMERKTGVLVVTRETPDSLARVHLRQGRVVRAELEGADAPVGAALIYMLVSWREGAFAFNTIEVDVEDTVQASTTHLLIEGARRLDEQGR